VDDSLGGSGLASGPSGLVSRRPLLVFLPVASDFLVRPGAANRGAGDPAVDAQPAVEAEAFAERRGGRYDAVE
jgi:hypothetical protein